MGSVIAFRKTAKQSAVDSVERQALMALPLSTLCRLRRMAEEERDTEWAATIDSVVLERYGPVRKP
jgi:hypothetical protein